MRRRYAFIAVVFSLLSMGVGIALTTVRAETGADVRQPAGIVSTQHSFVAQTDDRANDRATSDSTDSQTRRLSKFDKMLRSGIEMTTRANASAAIQTAPLGLSSQGGQEIRSWSTSSSGTSQFVR